MNVDRECAVCGTVAPETTMEFEQGSHWMRGTFRCYDTDACDRRASGMYVTGDYDDTDRPITHEEVLDACPDVERWLADDGV